MSLRRLITVAIFCFAAHSALAASAAVPVYFNNNYNPNGTGQLISGSAIVQYTYAVTANSASAFSATSAQQALTPIPGSSLPNPLVVNKVVIFKMPSIMASCTPSTAAPNPINQLYINFTNVPGSTQAACTVSYQSPSQ
jgi:hypothetical protein